MVRLPGVHPGLIGVFPVARNPLAHHRLGSMFRELFWFTAVAAIACAVTGLLDRQQVARRRELWAEATD